MIGVFLIIIMVIATIRLLVYIIETTELKGFEVYGYFIKLIVSGKAFKIFFNDIKSIIKSFKKGFDVDPDL